jgi:site-specific recombinase XerD
MARPKKGWTTYFDARRGVYFVRFTHDGRRHTLPTGESDPGAAARAAGRIYAEVLAGRRGVDGKVAAPSKLPFLTVAAGWLADLEPVLDPATHKIYENVYVCAHFAPFFQTIERLTSVRVDDYITTRLKQVQRETVKKEVTALRGFAKWAAKRGYLAKVPEFEMPGRLVLGTRSSSRKSEYQIFSAKEITAILAKLPEWTKPRRVSGPPFPVRARYELAWETALRPATLDKLLAPDDYQKGARRLLIRDAADKTRFGRELPLSSRARRALDSVIPASGLIFGKHDCRVALRNAAKAAGIDERRAGRISDYDFRHSRLTFLGTRTDNLSGVMYLAGHRQPATTARYLRPQLAAAEEVLASAQLESADTDVFWLQSGCSGENGGQMDTDEPPEFPSDFDLVRGGGIEPPWLLTASTSS